MAVPVIDVAPPKAPKTGHRGAMDALSTVVTNLAANAAKATPHAPQHQASLEARMGKGIMPKDLPGLLWWYSKGWDDEVPTALHKSEVWRDHGTGPLDPQAGQGSKLSTPAWSEGFRRYLEGMSSEMDADGYYARPMHAALSRLHRTHPLTARALFAVAQSGYDWRGVGTRGHWAEEMFELYIKAALMLLWREYSDVGLRLQ